MSTDKLIVVPHGSEQKTTMQGLSERGWKIIGSTIAGMLLVLNGNAQCINDKINSTFNRSPGNGAYIGVDVVTHTGTGRGAIEIGGNQYFVGYLNGILDTDGYIEYNDGDVIQIMPTVEGMTGIGVFSDEPGCQINTGSNRQAMNAPLPIKRSRIASYVKDGELRVDAESSQAVNVDYVDMEVSVDGSDFIVEDTEKAINGNVPRTYNFSASVDELIRKYKIVRPTVFYTRLTNHDLDGQTQTTDVQAVEISPDGTVTPLKVVPNIAQNAEHIKFVIGGDAETLYPVRLVNLATGTVIANETFIAGSAEHSLSDVISTKTLTAGNYVIQVMGLGNNGVVTQRFVIIP